MLIYLDVQTRSTSTYLMLDKTLKYQHALNRYKIVDKNYRRYPSSEEWKSHRLFLRSWCYFTRLLIWCPREAIQLLTYILDMFGRFNVCWMFINTRKKLESSNEEYNIVLAIGAVWILGCNSNILSVVMMSLI